MNTMYSAPRTMLSGRIPEYLENIKGEFEQLAHDVNMYKMQRDDYERKLQAQLTELSNIQQTLYDLERNHTKFKQQYEDEIMRLRRQLEMQSSSIPGGPGSSSSYSRSVSPDTRTTGGVPPPNVSIGPATPPVVPSGPLRSDARVGGPSTGGPVNIPLPSPSPSGDSSKPTSAPGSGMFYPGTLAPLDPNNAKQRGPVTGGTGAFQAPTPSTPTNTNPMSTNGIIGSNNPINKRGRDASDYYSSIQPPQGGFPGMTTPPGTSITNSNSAGELTNLNKQAKTETMDDKIKVDQRRGVTGNVASANNSSANPIGITSSNSNNNINNNIDRNEINSKDDKMKTSNNSNNNEGEGNSDWIVGYNPGVQTNLNVDLLHTLEHNSVVCCVKFSMDGKYMASGCNKSAQIYDVETGEKVHTFSEDIGKEGDLYIRSVCFSPDGKYLAAGAEDKTVKLWDIENKRLQHTFVGHELDIYSLDFSRDGRFIVSGSGDKKAKIWDVEKGECLFTLGNEEVGPKDGVTSVAFSPDGRLVAAGSLDRIVRLWDAQTGYFLERYEGHLDSVYSVAFSPDGKSLASGSLDKTLKLWDFSGSRSRSRCRSNFAGHKDFVLSVAFSPDGNWLISGSKDRSVQFWDPRSAVSHMMLQGHKNSVISVAVSPVGGHFATGSGDFRARIWKYE